MSTREDFFIGPLVRVTVPVLMERILISKRCMACSNGDETSKEYEYCPFCRAKMVPIYREQEKFSDPVQIEEIEDELINTDNVSYPDTIEIDGSLYKQFILHSNKDNVPGFNSDNFDLLVIEKDCIEDCLCKFAEHHVAHLEILRAHYGAENVEIFFGAVRCYW